MDLENLKMKLIEMNPRMDWEDVGMKLKFVLADNEVQSLVFFLSAFASGKYKC